VLVPDAVAVVACSCCGSSVVDFVTVAAVFVVAVEDAIAIAVAVAVVAVVFAAAGVVVAVAVAVAVTVAVAARCLAGKLVVGVHITMSRFSFFRFGSSLSSTLLRFCIDIVLKLSAALADVTRSGFAFSAAAAAAASDGVTFDIFITTN